MNGVATTSFGYVSWHGIEYHFAGYCCLAAVGFWLLLWLLIVVPIRAYRKSRQGVKYK